jgi:hypothetical protein
MFGGASCARAYCYFGLPRSTEVWYFPPGS